MKSDVEKLMLDFDREGLRRRAERYLEKYPESAHHLTRAELREQILFHPDAALRPMAASRH